MQKFPSWTKKRPVFDYEGEMLWLFMMDQRVGGGVLLQRARDYTKKDVELNALMAARVVRVALARAYFNTHGGEPCAKAT